MEKELKEILNFESQKQFESHLKQGKLREAYTDKQLLDLMKEGKLWKGEKDGVYSRPRLCSKGYIIDYFDAEGYRLKVETVTVYKRY